MGSILQWESYLQLTYKMGRLNVLYSLLLKMMYTRKKAYGFTWQRPDAPTYKFYFFAKKQTCHVPAKSKENEYPNYVCKSLGCHICHDYISILFFCYGLPVKTVNVQ